MNLLSTCLSQSLPSSVVCFPFHPSAWQRKATTNTSRWPPPHSQLATACLEPPIESIAAQLIHLHPAGALRRPLIETWQPAPRSSTWTVLIACRIALWPSNLLLLLLFLPLGCHLIAKNHAGRQKLLAPASPDCPANSQTEPLSGASSAARRALHRSRHSHFIPIRRRTASAPSISRNLGPLKRRLS